MKMTSLTTIIQRSLLLLNAMQLTYLGAGYLNGAFTNQYPILERLFKPEIASVCTSSGCWQSILPFLGSMYLSTAFISILALFFRSGREMMLMMFGLASVHLLMATIRLAIAPSHMYINDTAIQASAIQLFVGLVMLLCAIMPYSNSRKEN